MYQGKLFSFNVQPGKPPGLLLPLRLLLCLALLAGLSGAPMAARAGPGEAGATAGFSPNPGTLTGCVETVVELWVYDVIDLYGLDVSLTFDPALLEVVDADLSRSGVQVAAGGFLVPGFVVRNQADNTAGTIEYIATQLNPTPPASGSGVLLRITLRARAAGVSPLHVVHLQFANRNGGDIPVTPADGSANAQPGAGPTLSISKLGGNDLRLSWTADSGASQYILYRATTPYFTPGTPYQTTTATSFDDLGVLGSDAVQHYYLVRAVCANGFASADSNRVGEYEYPIRRDLASQKNDIALVFNLPGVTRASHLAAYLGNWVTRISRYNAAGQYFQTYQVGLPSTDFAITLGDYLMLTNNNTAPAYAALTGSVPAYGTPVFSLVGGSPAKKNFISMPLNRPDLTTASAVAASIGSGVARVFKFNANVPGFQNYLPGNPATDFPLVIGEAFGVTLLPAAPPTWP